MVGILIVEVYERVGKSVIWVCGKGPRVEQTKFYGFLLYRHECFTGKYTTRKKLKKNYIRDPSGLFSIISHLSLSMISLISSSSLKLYLNSLVYHRNIFGSSSRVFGNFRKFSENVRERSPGLRTILENLRKSSEGGRKSSENHQKRRHQHVYIIKRTLHGGLKI